MKLPVPASPLSVANQLVEFDTWVTPALAEIRDSAKFESELSKVVSIFDALASTTNNFQDVADCAPDRLTTGLTTLIAGMGPASTYALLDEAASLLFLVTGKTDNNAKCQFPIHLKNVAKWPVYPGKPTVKAGKFTLGKPVEIPRVIKSDAYLKLVGSYSGAPVEQQRLLLEYVKFLISDERYAAQLWALGSSYVKMKEVGHGKELLSSLVIFKVRGSASAIAGHKPEAIMRALLQQLGMVPGLDYNLSDAVVQDLVDESAVEELELNGPSDATEAVEVVKAKTRAYDFVLPFAVPGWQQRLFIQSQFYAGDAGSVSHKVVDQTTASRAKVRTQNAAPLFIEYLDGAGYFSALNGDLRKLLEKEDTHSFIQVRSAPVRLRRALQEIGFLVPLEIEHAIARTPGGSGEVAAVESILLAEGYAQTEVSRAIAAATSHGIITQTGSTLAIKPERREFARRLFFLDVIARGGTHFTSVFTPGNYIIPGYGDFFGLSPVDTLEQALYATTLFNSEFQHSQTLLADIQWLEQKQYLMTC